MTWEEYEFEYQKVAKKNNINPTNIISNLNYAKRIFNNGVPIIFDEYHFSKLVGIDYSYMYKVANDPRKFYRSFSILKHDGSRRKIDEPLPTLKIIQNWILKNILYKTNIHPSAKAYKTGLSLKENVKYHRNQKYVLKLDIVKFFNSISEKLIFKYFFNLGYEKKLALLLSKLCVLNNSLPQGAPTSPYLSNIALKDFDNKIYKYSRKKNIRYTRYADDMTFSGDFNKSHIIQYVSNQLNKIDLILNEKKIRLLKQHQRQIVTGIIVNKKLQLSKDARRQLRQEIYYIKKYGLEDHLNTISPVKKNISNDKIKYVKSLLGKVQFGIFINKGDQELIKYRDYLISLKQDIYSEITSNLNS